MDLLKHEIKFPCIGVKHAIEEERKSSQLLGFYPEKKVEKGLAHIC